jgi:NAD(P)H-flavin reductase
VAYQDLHIDPSKSLPKEVIDFITNADTAFIASIYKSEVSTTERYPSHAGMNSRGGLPGFMRVRPSDGRTVILPDYSGNRFLSSLGNIESTKLAGLTIVSFTTGDILYLTGTAHILIGPPALEIMARQASIAIIDTTGYTFVRDAFPIRQDPKTEVDRSPYSPKIKYLLEEPESQAIMTSGHQGHLISAVQFAPDIATLRFEVISKPGVSNLKIRPGQAIVLDFMEWIGPPEYQHMSNSAPGSINDDRVRTWTVSSSHEDQEVQWFELTMREMKGGAITGALFKVLKEYPLNKWGIEVKIDAVKVVPDIVGITGDFYLGEGYVNMLWVAGGIGITPFMAMLTALLERKGGGKGNVILALSTREPDIFLNLLKVSLHRTSSKFKFRIDLFTSQEKVGTMDLEKMNVQAMVHKGRIPRQYWGTVAGDRDVFICGPGGFGDAAMSGLRASGVPIGKIKREGFY